MIGQENSTYLPDCNMLKLKLGSSVGLYYLLFILLFYFSKDGVAPSVSVKEVLNLWHLCSRACVWFLCASWGLPSGQFGLGKFRQQFWVLHCQTGHDKKEYLNALAHQEILDNLNSPNFVGTVLRQWSLPVLTCWRKSYKDKDEWVLCGIIWKVLTLFLMRPLGGSLLARLLIQHHCQISKNMDQQYHQRSYKNNLNPFGNVSRTVCAVRLRWDHTRPYGLRRGFTHENICVKAHKW